MSAASRRAKRPALPGLEGVTGRHPDNFYRTPPWATDWLVRGPCAGLDVSAWLDAGAGDGAIAARLADAWPLAAGTAIELDGERAAACQAALPRALVVRGDVRQVRTGARYDLAVSNPPFPLALAFAKVLVRLAGRVAILQRVGWAEGALDSRSEDARERDAFFRFHRPGLAVLSKRPGFNGQGTDSATYAWFLFGPGWSGRFWRLPVEEGGT